MFSSSNSPKKKYEENAETMTDVNRVVDRENIDDILVKGMGDIKKEFQEKTKSDESYTQVITRSVRSFAADPSGALSNTWKHVKEEANQYWLGSKLLWREMKMAKSIILRLLEGNAITRRERLQLTRTTLDIFRLVPFALFVLIPFMEFLLPVALKMFPNMLPSTFATKLKKEENMKKELQLRLGVASFLQETLVELAKRKKGSSSDATSASATEVLDFMEKARKGEPLPNSQVIKMASLFEDELTLANISRPQLIIMCQYMGMKPFGGDGILRFQLRNKMRAIKEDDRRILWEGVDFLTLGELQDACRERGMRAYGMDEISMRNQIREWLDLSIQKNTPISLLIMSRAFSLTVSTFEGSAEKLGKTISSFDEDVINEVVLSASKGNEEDTVDMKLRKLESLEHQEELIDDEREEREEAKARVKEETSLLKDNVKRKRGDSSESAVEAVNPNVEVPDELEEKQKESIFSQELTLAEMETLADLARGSSVAREKDTLNMIKSKMTLDDKIQSDEMEDKEKTAAEEITAMNESSPEASTLQASESSDTYSQSPAEGLKAPLKLSEVEVATSRVLESKTDESKADIQQSLRQREKQESLEMEIEDAVNVRDASYLKSLYSKMLKYSTHYTSAKDGSEDKEINSLRNALDKWITKTETRISKTEVALGDKLEGLDKDHDGNSPNTLTLYHIVIKLHLTCCLCILTGLLHGEEIGEFVKKVMKNPNPVAAAAFVEMLDRDRDGDYFSCFELLLELINFVDVYSMLLTLLYVFIQTGIISVKELLEYIEERKHVEEENISSGSTGSPAAKMTDADKKQT